MDKLAVSESGPRGITIAALAVPFDFTSSSCSGVDLAPKFDFVLAFEDHAAGTPQDARARIAEVAHAGT